MRDIIERIIEYLPDSVKKDIVGFMDVRLKDGRFAIRVVSGHILTDEEKDTLKKHKDILGVDCVGHYQYAPEIKRSYFYVVK